VLASSLPRPSGEEPDIDALLEESEGLPLYLVESLAADPRARGPLPTETPRAFRTILRDRLASVGETSAQVAAAAAVLGRAFDLAAVRATSGRSEEEIVLAVEELLRRGIVREGGMGGPQGYDFAHAKLRDAAYEATSLARRRLLHRRAAEWIRSDPASARDLTRLAQLARHERAAGRDAAAADAFRAAGELARAVFANREALDHLESALALGHPEALDLMIEIGELRTAVADYPGAAAILEAAAAVATAAELPRIELLLGRIQMRRGDLAAAGSHLDAAVEDLRTAGTSATPLLARAIVDRGLVAHRVGDMERATVLGSEALSLAAGVAADGVAGDGPALSAAERLMGLLARDAGDLAGARHHLERSLALAGDAGDAVGAIAAGNVLALVEASAGELPAAIARLERVVAACRERGLRHLEAAVENNLADQLHAAGRREESIERLKHAVAIFADLGGRPGELEPEIWKLVEW
jgi:tetratricopeptide (TPR) repeat protein